MSTRAAREIFAGEVRDLLARWEREGLPGRQGFIEAARSMRRWRACEALPGLWTEPPLMMTATLDDGFGFGLEVIHEWGETLGLRVQPLGLLQAPETILDACSRAKPELLGLTVLQLDSDEALIEIGRALPSEVTLVAGGPVFRAMPELAERARVAFVANNAADFIRFLLDNGPFDPR